MKPTFLAFVLVMASACHRESTTHQSPELVEFGRFQKMASGSDVLDPGAIAGKRHAATKVQLLECTTNIPARIGTSFGLRVKLPERFAARVVPCYARCLHPRLSDPKSGRSSEVEQWGTSGLAGQDGFVGYTLDHDWELIPGSWTIQFYFESQLALEKTFNLYSERK